MFLLQVNKKSYREHIIIPETNVSDKGRACLPVGKKKMASGRADFCPRILIGICGRTLARRKLIGRLGKFLEIDQKGLR
jgi:hypothetical protein